MSSTASDSRRASGSTPPTSTTGSPPHPHLEDVAIVGMSCRTAGGNNTPEKLWQFLLDKGVASGEVPPHRWEPWLRRDARNAKEIGKTLTKGYFIEDLENFDAAFFGISPKEAEQMDPHQRLALELSWEALENAGIDPKSLAKSDTAVYMAHGIPNRVSYHLDLMGLSATVDAACASSLVAFHMGRQAILNGESEVALVGGVNVLLAPALTLMLGKAGALSPEGICRSFDDAANGYARGEGGAVIVLKRLSSAMRDGDHVLATLKGSAVAQDGKTNGIMAPNAKAQVLVANQALSRAGIDPLTVGYVEAHATSTPLGDPTEISAISAIYGAGAGRPVETPVRVGSIKPNVGHLEAAAGAIGLVKAVLAVKKVQLAPQANLINLNSRVDWDNSGLDVVREMAKWGSAEGPRRAAVCSYGYGGTVSHAIIEEFNSHDEQAIGHLVQDGPSVLFLSAFQEKRLRPQAKALAEWLSTPSGQDTELDTVANTLRMRRAHFVHRVAIVAETHQDAVSALEAFAANSSEDSPPTAQGLAFINDGPVWVFSGHGAQWKNMGKEIMSHPVFEQTAVELDTVIKPKAGFSAQEALKDGDFDSSSRIQILTYVIQIALSRVFQSLGVFPQAIIGHSVGEIAASVIAGCLSPSEGASIVLERAKLYDRARDECVGGMALVNMFFKEAQSRLSGRSDLVAAIDSSPTTCVVSGTATATDQFVEDMKASGIRTFRVKTDIGFHSPLLKGLEAPLREALLGTKAIRARPPRIPVYSTSQDNMRSTKLRDIDYWIDNMIRPVQLTGATQAAIEDGHRVFMEISSHPIVLHSVNETILSQGLDEVAFATIPTMKRDVPAMSSIQNAIAHLYVTGSKIDKTYFNDSQETRFDSRSIEHDSWWSRDVETSPWGDITRHDVDKHTLLGQRTSICGTSYVVFATKLDKKTKPFPGTHPLDGIEIIPAAVYINTFHHATGAEILSDIKLKVPVSMNTETRHLQIIAQDDSVSVWSSANDASSLDSGDPPADPVWVAHSSCKWSRSSGVDGGRIERFDVEDIKKRIGTILPNDFSASYLSKIGVSGIAFPWQVVEHYGNTREMIAKVDMNPSVEEMPWDEWSLAPLLDAATSVGSTIFFNDPKLRIVSQIDEVFLVSKKPLPKVAYLYIEAAADALSLASHVSILDLDGQLLAKFQSMRFSEIEGASGISGSTDSLVHRTDWVPPRNFSEEPRVLDSVLLVANENSATYSVQLKEVAKSIFTFASADELSECADPTVLSAFGQNCTTIVYAPDSVESLTCVAPATEEFIWQTASLVRLIEEKGLGSSCKLFVITNRSCAGLSATAPAHGALYGLARIIASEHSDLWGGLLDTETPAELPLLAMKYANGHDVLRIKDGLPRRAIARPLSSKQRHKTGTTSTMLPKPEGTYVITGGFGDFGLETLCWLAEKGARRLIVLSRSGLPPRSQWTGLVESNPRKAAIIQKIERIEKMGAVVHALALDISAPGAATALTDALERLGLPPVLGVVHAAGVLEDGLLMHTTRVSFARVLAPKVSGALALHEAFPPASLDFFVMYSSIGQLVGTTGQASYASGNAFLDGLAAYRRGHGDNAVAFQFTALRGLGMATTTDFLQVEFESKGITDISHDEAFQAWEHVAKFDIATAIVTRCRPIEEGTAPPVPLFDEVAPRLKRVSSQAEAESQRDAAHAIPTDAIDLEKWLQVKIRECIASVLLMNDIDDIDGRTPMAELGVDSVMTVALRTKLQSTLRITVPPTLTWNHPTVNQLVPWFVTKIQEQRGLDDSGKPERA